MSALGITARVSRDMDAQTSTTTPAPARPGATAVSSRATTDDGIVALSHVLSGILLYGGLGWIGWRSWHQFWMLPLGLVLGMVLGTYLVYRRYATPTQEMEQ